jgi:hypothetical protein
MKTTGYRGVLPFYGAALIWLLYCRFFPLYLPVHFLIVIALSAGAGALLHKMPPPREDTETTTRTDISTKEDTTSLVNKER